MHRSLWVAVGALGMLAAAACGGSSSPPPGTALAGVATAAAAVGSAPAVTDTPTPIGPVVVGSPRPPATATPFSDAQRTAIAEGRNVPLDQYRDPDGKYTIGLPRGWTLVTQANVHAVAVFLAGDPYYAARIHLSCAKDAPIDAMMKYDQYVYQTSGAGTLPIASAQPLRVAGNDGQEVVWQAAYEGVPAQYWFTYFVAGGCGWRLNLTVVGSASAADLHAVFQRVMDSLRIL